jgi:glycosyltransferase involved in cell wall biosynthesis
MRLLIITQKVDKEDDAFSFFHRWIVEFAKHCEQVTVVALGVGKYDLPANVRVFSLGKERGVSRASYLASFYSIIWRERKNYDFVFVHMNPIYVILGGVFWQMWNKKIALWYTHKNVDLKLRLAEKLAHIIFSASQKSFRLPSKKLFVAGHGIDVDIFKFSPRQPESKLRIITAGRISPVKNLETLFDATLILIKENMPVHVEIVGDIAQKSDEKYFEKLRLLIHKNGLEEQIHFAGRVPNSDLPHFLTDADIFVNMSETGSLDKGVLEAMAMGIIPVTSNEAFREIFGGNSDLLMFPPKNAQDLAKRLSELTTLSVSQRNELVTHLRQIIVEKHNLAVLIPRLVNSMVSLR